MRHKYQIFNIEQQQHHLLSTTTTIPNNEARITLLDSGAYFRWRKYVFYSTSSILVQTLSDFAVRFCFTISQPLHSLCAEVL